ncbi:PepSY domain-containing protein [Azospirillum sp. sgz301742]
MRLSAGSTLPLLVCCLFFAAVTRAPAGEDHDRARDAVRAGRILPLERVAESAKQQFGGEILDVELEDEEAGFHYELKMMAPDGRILKLIYDAATGELLRVKGRGRHHEGWR